MGKWSSPKREQVTAGQPRVLLVLEIVLVYALLVLLLVCLSIVFRIPLFSEGRPTSWLRFTQFAYYVFPAMMSISFGLLFRPFWLNLLRSLFFILALQFAYSLVSYGLRAEYLERLEEEFSRSRLAVLKVEKFSHRFIDESKDGVMDRAMFEGEFSIVDLPPGKYALAAIVSQGGKELPKNPAAWIENDLRPEVSNFKVRFEVDLSELQPYFKNGPLDLDISLRKIWKIGNRGKRILGFARWSPYLRFTSWEGEDQAFKPRREDLGIRERADRFYLLPLQ